MAFGALDERLALPDYIYVIGLVLFVYAIGLQSGTGFFSSFRKRGFRINLAAVLILCGGAVGVILWSFLFSKLFKIDFAKEEAERLKESGSGSILSRTFRVINPALTGKTVEEALRLLGEPGFVLSRIKKDEAIFVVVPSTILADGDSRRLQALQAPYVGRYGRGVRHAYAAGTPRLCEPARSNEIPNVWYAAVYPASMIAKIILAQLIVSLLLVM
jgi:uncharacterized transporter YbjL